MKKKSNTMIYLAIALILIVVTGSLIANALARYANKFNGTATVNTANWSFTAGTLDTTIDLTQTQRESNPNLIAGKIAPGTSGSFDINLDGSGSETGVKYVISLTKPEGAPTGLTLKVNSQVVDNITGYIAYSTEENAMKKTVTVNWEWTDSDDDDVETGSDNTYAGETYSVGVVVRGEQWTADIPLD